VGGSRSLIATNCRLRGATATLGNGNIWAFPVGVLLACASAVRNGDRWWFCDIRVSDWKSHEAGVCYGCQGKQVRNER
jgi:hypothetical protein